MHGLGLSSRDWPDLFEHRWPERFARCWPERYVCCGGSQSIYGLLRPALGHDDSFNLSSWFGRGGGCKRRSGCCLTSLGLPSATIAQRDPQQPAEKSTLLKVRTSH
jgi:hypothetical protein